MNKANYYEKDKVDKLILKLIDKRTKMCFNFEKEVEKVLGEKETVETKDIHNMAEM